MDTGFGVSNTRTRNALEEYSDSDSMTDGSKEVELDDLQDRQVLGEDEDPQNFVRDPDYTVKANWDDEDDEEEDEGHEKNREKTNNGESDASEAVSQVKVEPYDFNNLPAESCAYCGIHDHKAIV